MSNKELQLGSGATVVITTAPFADAHALLKALLAANKGLPLAKNVLDMDISVIKEAVLAAATSPEVEAALFRCFDRVTYEGVKVARGIFDDPKLGDQARADFYLLAWEVVRHNCAPFFGQAFSLLKERLGTPAAAPASQ